MAQYGLTLLRVEKTNAPVLMLERVKGARGTIYLDGDAVLPEHDLTTDLGSPACRWSNVYSRITDTRALDVNHGTLAVAADIVAMEGRVLVNGSSVITRRDLDRVMLLDTACTFILAGVGGALAYIGVMVLRAYQARLYAAREAAKRGPDGGPYRGGAK